MLAIRAQEDAGVDIVSDGEIRRESYRAWAGGSARGSCTDAHGPAATGEMLRFFLETDPRA